ncbi:DUF1963 domain-containing protein [Nonomuraea sp. NPDC049695]|uniref:DUF1963 domain-containing protein n=1 Tax=Nonomuraea sp. NPDC049695 TaxID=3154734 RepID=UPI0034361C67
MPDNPRTVRCLEAISVSGSQAVKVQADTIDLMDLDAAANELYDLCVTHLGEHVGRQLAALARPTAALIPTASGVQTGRSRLGGPALLNPGTAWPEYEGHPLSLLAVIDSAHLGSWADAYLPNRPCLLNFFFLQIDDLDYQNRHPHLRAALPGLGNPLTCRIIPADSRHAEEVCAPPLATSFTTTSLHMVTGLTLPDFADDPVLNSLDLGTHAATGIYGAMPGLFVDEKFGSVWADHMARQSLFDEHTHRVFGWPSLGAGSCLRTSLRAKEEFVHILELTSTREFQWGDGGSLHFVSPAGALHDGDFTRVVADASGW